jgi:hypothetical protein
MIESPKDFAARIYALMEQQGGASSGSSAGSSSSSSGGDSDKAEAVDAEVV